MEEGIYKVTWPDGFERPKGQREMLQPDYCLLAQDKNYMGMIFWLEEVGGKYDHIRGTSGYGFNKALCDVSEHDINTDDVKLAFAKIGTLEDLTSDFYDAIMKAKSKSCSSCKDCSCKN